MNDRPGVRIAIVDCDLGRGQRVLENFVFDPGERERAGNIEALRLEIAGDEFHRRDASGADLGYEGLMRHKGRLRSPQTESPRVCEVGDIGSACCRSI